MADLNKLVEEISALSLLEAAELVKLLESKLGVTAAAPMAMAAMPAGGAAAGAAAAPVEEKTEFNVVLKAAGEKKIEVIKAVRQIVTTLGLKEAKELVDTSPQPVLQGVGKDAANDAKSKLETAGATVVIE
jgi:large subunit ribosomal protein L7/L12